MAKKEWLIRLNETVATIKLLLGDEAEALVTATLKPVSEKDRETISKEMSLGWTIKKKGTVEYAERKTRRAVVLLEAIALLIPSMAIGTIKLRLSAALSAAKDVRGEALTRLLDDKWRACRTAKEQLDRFHREARENQLRQAAEQRRRQRLAIAPREQALRDNARTFMGEFALVPTPSVSGPMDCSVIDVAERDLVKRMELTPSSRRRGAFEIIHSPEGADDGFPAYFLPWASRHITRIKIPAYRAGTPDLFYTSALSGCSVFVTGSASEPVVWHAGVDGTVGEAPKPPGALGDHWTKYNAVEFWRRCLLQVFNRERARDAPELGMDALLDELPEVNKTHYVDDVSLPGREPSEDERGTTAHSRAFRALHTGGRDQVELDTISCWGCVFGLRSADRHEWAFYLQENVCISYIKGEQEDPVYYARSFPLAVRKFFPWAEGGHTFPVRAWETRLDARTAFTVDNVKVFS